MTIRPGTLISLLILLLPATIAAQAPGSTTVVEIVGLREWTRGMVEDSLAKYAPGTSLEDRGCAVILRDSVGFADASYIRLRGFGDTAWVVIPVVEPSAAHLIRFPEYTVAAPPVEEWSDVFEVLGETLRPLAQFRTPEVVLGDADSLAGRPLSEETLRLREVLRRHDTGVDWELARNTILTDSSFHNRAVAALVLSNFPARDSAFYLLVGAIRAPDIGGSAAMTVLTALSRGAQPPSDWSPAREALEALVGGTAIQFYPAVLDLMRAWEIDRDLGRELMRVNPELLFDHLGARNPMTPLAPHRFLTYISGTDFGRDTAAWRAWLERRE